ncbi:hypothetical protein [Bradyrhizobium brasilense]|uniref:hypothetical protein n=1 Tax=Bradyrhizobium brasilense TaxID=1419277 RepID=UPI001E3C6909|nr:hypothetical protein [Bradyrhizobium brasilense]MCC8969157.1 hypothetical protein [Bradyrhizobium brasilense]
MIARSIPGISAQHSDLIARSFGWCEARSLGHFSGWKQLGGLDADEEGYHAPGA